MMSERIFVQERTSRSHDLVTSSQDVDESCVERRRSATMMQRLTPLLAAAALGGTLFAGAPSHAGVIEVFNASGVLANGSVLSGTVQIDLTAGSIVASNLTFSMAPIGPYTNIITAVPEPTFAFYDFNVVDAANNNFSSGLHGGSLVGYTGGAFCSDTNECNSGSVSSALVVAPGRRRLSISKAAL